MIPCGIATPLSWVYTCAQSMHLRYFSTTLSRLSVVGDKLNLDVGSASRELGDTDASPSGLGVGHHLLVDLMLVSATCSRLEEVDSLTSLTAVKSSLSFER